MHDLIYKNQSGFRKQYSTETALAYIVDTLLFNLDRNHIHDMVLVDYKKAFDMVDHVLSKLEAYKLDRNVLLWLESYREKYHSGCATGFHIGFLTFFVLFINDLNLHAHTQLDMFADALDCASVEELKNAHSTEVSNVNE